MANVQTTGNSSVPAGDVLYKYGASSRTGTAGEATGAAGKASATEDPQNRFLKLLVTQLKNQDPLNPLDNAQMTSQLAQMSTVSGIEKLNTTLGGLVDSLGNSQTMQASAMIGKKVLVPGNKLALAGGQAVGGVKLEPPADEVTVSVLDANGKVVQSHKLGAQPAGVLDFVWDGKTDSGAASPDGNYTFKVDAVRGGAGVKVEALNVGTVSAVVRTGSGFQLDLGALGSVDFKSVQEIL